MTVEQFLLNVKRQLMYFKSELYITQTLLIELERWDARKITKAVEKNLTEVLTDQYRVTYYYEKPDWKTITFQRIGDIYKNFNWKFYVQRDRGKLDTGVFDFTDFDLRHPLSRIRELIVEYEAMNENLAQRYLSQFIVLRQYIHIFQLEIKQFKSFERCLDKKDEKQLLLDVQFHGKVVDKMSTTGE